MPKKVPNFSKLITSNALGKNIGEVEKNTRC